MPNKPNQRGRDRESTWKTIENNESENDPKYWKKKELQVNSLDTRIDKMQEMFNKDLEKKLVNI